jgi:hypothetical protein
MSSGTDPYDYRTHLRAQHTHAIAAQEGAFLQVEAQVSRLNRLDYMEDSSIDIRKSIKDLLDEIKQAAQADAGANKTYMEWLEKRIKAGCDGEEQQRRQSSESESEEESKEEDTITENLYHLKGEPRHKHRTDSIVAFTSVPKQDQKVLEKRPARPGR